MSSLPEPNETIAANTVSINRLGLECWDDMQGAQAAECEVDSHDMSRPDKGYLAVLTSLISNSPPRAFEKADTIVVVGLKLPVVLILCLSVQYFYPN